MSQSMTEKRNGYAVYLTNPSLDGAIPCKTKNTTCSKLGNALMISPESGEFITQGTFGFMEEKEIDSEQFVKVYLAGIRKYAELSKAGCQIFEFIYEQMSGYDAKDQDRIGINFFLIKQWRPSVLRRTYARGMKELLEKEFIFHSILADTYFINVRYIFNGDRIILAQSYKRKDTGKSNKKKLT